MVAAQASKPLRKEDRRRLELMGRMVAAVETTSTMGLGLLEAAVKVVEESR